MFEQLPASLPDRQVPMQLEAPQQESTPVTMEDKKPIVVAEDVMMQYPSPSDGPDAQYYHIPTTREQVLAPPAAMLQQIEAERSDQPEPDLTPLQEHQEHSQSQEQHQEDEHHNLHELQELQDSPTQHHNTTVVSVDELQLAAQLTQGLTQHLAPIIAAAQQQEQEQESQLHSQEDVEMQNQGDANLHEQLQAQLQNHDQMQSHQQQMQGHEEMQGHDQLQQAHDELQVHQGQMNVHQELQARHQQQLQTQQQQMQELQNHEQLQSREHDIEEVLSHADQPQVHPLYAQTTSQPQHGQPLTPIDGLPHSPYPLLDANTPPRKRSKVSRACDECRRKKIKCDAQSEPGGQPCSNCRRAAAQCLFSRVPQKRGPSKGYIKELADRIHNIEGKFGISKEDSAMRRSAEAYASPTPGDESRKRPYSSISGDGYSAQSPGGQPSWVPEHRPIKPYTPDIRPPFTVNNLAPKPDAPTPLFSGSLETIPQGQSDAMDGITENGLVQSGLAVDGLPHDNLPQDLQQRPEIDDGRFDCYLNVIHRTLPVLASSKLQVQLLLGQCPATLQNAFMNAFFALLKPFMQNAPNLGFGDSATANQLLLLWETEKHPRSQAADLVHLQTLIMMVIEADYHGMASIKGQAVGPPKSSALARAVGVGISMKLFLVQPDPTPGPNFNPDSDENVALRAWWTLIILDRWNAMGTASLSLMSNENVVIFPGLRYIVGDVVFLLIKMSYFMGLFTPLGIRPSLDPFESSLPVVGSFGNSIAESIRWQFPEELDDGREPALHLAYWHFRLLAQIFSTSWSPNLALQCCRNVARLLLGRAEMINPLAHHFVSLCSLVLVELTKVESCREEATKLAKDLVGHDIAASPWNLIVRGMLAKITAPPSTSADLGQDAAQRETSQTLQQLADLAASVDGTAPLNSEVPPTTQNEVPPQQQEQATAPVPDTVAETLKEELLDSIKGLQDEGQLLPPAPAPVAPSTGEITAPNNGNNTALVPAQKPLDPQAILRAGYLTMFDTIDGQPQQRESSSVQS